LVEELAVSRVFGRGKCSIPRDVREMLGVSDGDKILWYRNDRGEVCIRPVRKRFFVEGS